MSVDLFSSTSSQRRAKNSSRDQVKVGTQVRIWGLLMREEELVKPVEWQRGLTELQISPISPTGRDGRNK